MPDRAPAASSVQETIVVSKMRGNLVIFNQDNFMNHEPHRNAGAGIGMLCETGYSRDASLPFPPLALREFVL